MQKRNSLHGWAKHYGIKIDVERKWEKQSSCGSNIAIFDMENYALAEIHAWTGYGINYHVFP